VLSRKGSCSIFSIHLYFGFVTQSRKKAIDLAILDRMREVFANVCLKTNCILREFSGESDPVHLLVDSPPDNKISDFTSSLKSASSRGIRKEFKEQDAPKE
jgi:putative transposase